jgi:ribosomal protein L7/L12
MTELIIKGWKPGLKTISLMDALRTHCGMGLKEAKTAVDGLLDGREIRLSRLADDTANNLRREIESLGVICVEAQRT